MKAFLASRKFLALCIFIGFIFVLGFALQPKEKFWVFDGDNCKVVYISASASASAKKVIVLAGLNLNRNDNYVFSAGNIIQVVRAIPVSVFVDGRQQEIFTGELTVAEALRKADIDSNGFKVFPSETERPSKGMKIVLLRANEGVVEERQQIAYGVQKKPDSHMELGESAVIKEGVVGSKNVLVKFVELANGEKIRQVLAETIIMQPKEQIVAFGTSNTVATSRGALRFSKVVRMRASAYTPWDEGCIGITRTGIPAKHGVVAVDPHFIALGTRLYIPGYGHALAADTGGAIKGDRIDLCMETRSEALKFGRRNVKVYILE